MVKHVLVSRAYNELNPLATTAPTTASALRASHLIIITTTTSTTPRNSRPQRTQKPTTKQASQQCYVEIKVVKKAI
jgi:hypothetical protein